MRPHPTVNNTPDAEVCSSGTQYTIWILAPPATSRHRERKPEPLTEDMAYAMAEEHRLRKFGVKYNGAMEDAIVTRWKNP